MEGLLDDTTIPNLYSYVESDINDVSMPERYEINRYNSPIFLHITGNILTLWLIIASFVALSQLTLFWKFPKIRKIGDRIRNFFIYNGIIRMILVSVFYFMLGSLLNLRFGISSSVLSIFNTILSVITWIWIFFFAVNVLHIITKY